MDGIADLRSEAQLARVGLAVPLPRRHGWPAFQEVGGQLHAEGWKGVRAVSAARTKGGEILCLFRQGEKVDGVKALRHLPSSEIRHPDLPPDRIAISGRDSTTVKGLLPKYPSET